MPTSEALQKIRDLAEQPELTYWQLRYLIKTGRIPAPEMNASLVWVWSENDISNAVNFLKRRAQQSAAASA